jgi:predicted nucleic acid-binding protein
MPVLVLDASVLIKWVIPPDNESHVEQALALRRKVVLGEEHLCLPSLWFHEVGNTLARRFPDQAGELMADLLAMGFEEIPHAAILKTTLDLTRRFGVTFYDASYHAAALVREGVLVTSDGRYLERAATAGRIQYLGDWSGS